MEPPTVHEYLDLSLFERADEHLDIPLPEGAQTLINRAGNIIMIRLPENKDKTETAERPATFRFGSQLKAAFKG